MDMRKASGPHRVTIADISGKGGMASRMSHSTPAMARRIVVRWAPDPCRSPGYTAPTSIPDTPEQQRDTALHRYPGVISIDEAPPAEALKAIRIRAAPPAIASSQPPQCDQIASPQALSSRKLLATMRITH
jgi:hypothetical protein